MPRNRAFPTDRAWHAGNGPIECVGLTLAATLELGGELLCLLHRPTDPRAHGPTPPLEESDVMIQVNKSFNGEGLPDAEPKFEPGQLVRHKRYGYRGVVVSAEGHCTADPVWYMSNRTQPDRSQPWYHVLVHESSTVTYAAESSLMPDSQGVPVEHPLVDAFFSDFYDGRHIRNDRPWPA